MQRRNLLATLALVTTAPCYAWAARPARVGFLSGGDEKGAETFVAAMLDGLRAEGYAEPTTMTLDRLYADYEMDKVPSLVAELQRRGVDLIVTHAAAAPIFVQDKERSVPVVYEFSADPIVIGLATDLAHPLFNATGITLMKAELNSKRLEFLHELAPSVRRVAVIANPLHGGEANERADLAAKAREFGIRLDFFKTPNRAELDHALATVKGDPPNAIVAFSEGFVVENRELIIGVANSLRIPVVSGWAVMAQSGALFTYGPRLVESYRRTAYFVGRILKGARPETLPIERPTVLELVINLKTARGLGLQISPVLLARADDTID
jgi:putative tryptophan/tyrosine transport system substrate-binding protein